MAASRRGHYKLHAYVGTNGVATPDVDGTVSFETVFIKRPDDCRYAIVGEWDIVSHYEKILVWDVLSTTMRASGVLNLPEPVMICGDVDQAIMAALMLGRDA